MVSERKRQADYEQLMMSAASRRGRVFLVYTDASGQETEREVTPVSAQEGEPSFIAICHLSDELRRFRYNRIIEAEEMTVGADGEDAYVLGPRVLVDFVELQLTGAPSILDYQQTYYAPEGGHLQDQGGGWFSIEGEFSGETLAAFIDELVELVEHETVLTLRRPEVPKYPAILVAAPGEPIKLDHPQGRIPVTVVADGRR